MNRDDDTVRTILERASKRAERVTERCRRISSSMRPPSSGPTDEVDARKLLKLRPPTPAFEEE